MTENRQPYAGVRILELGGGLAAAFCTRLFADFGADVIKIEPRQGDPLRVTPPLARTKSGETIGGMHLFLDQSKRSVALDVETPTGADLLGQLLRTADAIVDARQFKEVDPLETLRTQHPDVLWLRITPFGLTGPQRAWRGSDLVYQAVTACMYGWGRDDRPPLRTPGRAAEFLTGASSAAVLAAALRRASDWSKRAHLIDVSHAGTQLLVAVLDLIRYSYVGAIPHRVTVPFPGIVECADGYVGINLLTDEHWRNFCVMMGRIDLQEEPRFSSPGLRLAHSDELMEIFSPLIRQWRKMDLFEIGSQKYQIPISPVVTPSELLASPHLCARQYFVTQDIPEFGEVRLPGPYIRMEGADWTLRRPAPRLGQHSQEILGEIGLSAAEFEELAREGVVA